MLKRLFVYYLFAISSYDCILREQIPQVSQHKDIQSTPEIDAYCQKYVSVNEDTECNKGEVCGVDPKNPKDALRFEDICTLYHYNCQKYRVYGPSNDPECIKNASKKINSDFLERKNVIAPFDKRRTDQNVTQQQEPDLADEEVSNPKTKNR